MIVALVLIVMCGLYMTIICRGPPKVKGIPQGWMQPNPPSTWVKGVITTARSDPDKYQMSEASLMPNQSALRPNDPEKDDSHKQNLPPQAPEPAFEEEEEV